MPEHVYLTVAEVLEMYRQLIEEFGGIYGLRDVGLLEAAVFRPHSGYHDDLLHEAAALMESLANNHAFLDGNKRISLAATDTFLRMNGLYLELEPLAAHSFITSAISKREFRIRRIRDWLAQHAKPLRQG
ncbi:MAG TPA: type II toxin-antitoxin system death-on-curing family toxin [Methylomirabilota bacterium]|nr:type II toxin-antitoxin system death-on-curing family toxin [Methylomirabilota bacterium]